MDIRLLVICAVVSGADGWEAIEEFGKAKLQWRRQFVPFRNGVPSHDCIASVISWLSVKGFQACSASWTEALTEATGGQVIAVDGKTVSGSRDRARGRAVLHMVSAWGDTNRVVLGQEATAEKSNELTAIPKLLALLELTGCIVTLDAMGCQRELAAQLVNQGAEYVLGLKGNQRALHEAVKDFFAVAQADEFASIDHDFYEEVDKDHGRLEIRRYWITEALQTLPNTEQWMGLTQHRPGRAPLLDRRH
ncbi:ISAs1 family transposase [Candidatus Thiosymbion oneisti]|uniref:ISAs1 family transposase n=1 Tax=Candidatus Thiosymbion oneisti TaxID=589554 RepID=UPI000A3E0EF6|nr:ISAs1 family transposase [Candidatus Thiosymbion oneisti]